MTVIKAKVGWWALLAGALALTFALSGCGGATHSSVPAGPSPSSAGPAASGAGGTVTVPAPAGGAGRPDAVLQAVENDEQVAAAASDQSDADFNAGVSAQAQNDDP